MLVFPNAKINLGLNIVGKRPDGYHNLETVFYPISVEDALEVTESKKRKTKYVLWQNGINIGGSAEDNLVVKAYKKLDSIFDLPPVEIRLFKHIPFGAGLGGGSSDAAFMLKALNKLFHLSLTKQTLQEYASTLGADCAFFIENKPAFATGIGDVFSPIQLSLKDYQIVVVKPDIFVSTKDAFSNIIPHYPIVSIKDIVTCPMTCWKTLLYNDFEYSVFAKYPRLLKIKEELYEKHAIYASMSGSGSSIFGLYPHNLDISNIHFSFAKDAAVFVRRLM